MIGVSDDQDSRTGMPVASLYGSTFESLAPRPEHLAEIDVLVIDLQDVGSRYTPTSGRWCCRWKRPLQQAWRWWC